MIVITEYAEIKIFALFLSIIIVLSVWRESNQHPQQCNENGLLFLNQPEQYLYVCVQLQPTY